MKPPEYHLTVSILCMGLSQIFLKEITSTLYFSCVHSGEHLKTDMSIMHTVLLLYTDFAPASHR